MTTRNRRILPDVDVNFAGFDPLVSPSEDVTGTPVLSLYTLEKLLSDLPGMVEQFQRLMDDG